MYIVLTAMLALNVSSDVLNGFTLVEDGLKRTNSNVSDRNAALYMQLEEFTRQNPQKGKPWLDKAADVRRHIGFMSANTAIYDRMSVEVLISTENADDFETNRATMRCEERVGLTVFRPEAFVKGNFTGVAPQPPAGG